VDERGARETQRVSLVKEVGGARAGDPVDSAIACSILLQIMQSLKSFLSEPLEHVR
jgi:hypothetical protein